MNRLILPLALLLGAVATPALAGEHGGMHPCPMHGAMMTDADRAKAMDHMFGMLDANKDGSISRAEFDAHHAAMRQMHEHKHEAGEQAEEKAKEEAAHQH